MANVVVAIVCGVLFGAGLVVSDMINPERVLAFLDVTGAWDPSLAFVMGGALAPSAIGYLIRRRLASPIAAEAFQTPNARAIDQRLVGGAVLFGIGWGLVGLCPGPAIAALTTGQWQAFVFAFAMIVGMAAFRLTFDRTAPALARA